MPSASSGKKALAGATVALSVAASCLVGSPPAGAAGLPVGAGTSKAASAICDKVPLAAVGQAVGHDVPAPLALQDTFTIDPAQGIRADITACAYTGSLATVTNAGSVGLAYIQLNKPVALASLQKDLGLLVPGFSGYAAPLPGLGAPAIYLVSHYDGTPFEAVVAGRGRKVVVSATVGRAAKSQPVALARLALKAFL